MESYSLVTGIPIKELNALEVKLMVLMDYRFVINEGDFALLLQGDMDLLFLDKSGSKWTEKLIVKAMLLKSIDSCIEFFA